MNNPEGSQFLHEKDTKLHTTPPVENARTRAIAKGEKISQKPSDKIGAYLKRFEDVLNPSVLEHHPNFDRGKRNLEMLKKSLYDEVIIKPENVPESTFLLEQRIAREMGYGNVEITDEFREQKTRQIITDQKASLDRWVNYLSSTDATYPMWAKYWAFTSILAMGKFEKIEKEENGQKNEYGRFIKRTKDTVASFPTLNPRALAMTIGAMNSRLEQIKKPKDKREPVENISTKLDDPSFQQLLSTENFSKLYAQFLIEMPEYSTEGLQETRGKWVKYPKGSDPKPLVDSLEGYPLEWCTANIDTARTQLEGGDFYVYYSINQQGQANIPRLAIRMQGDKIAEPPRGIAHDQNLDPYIGDVLEKKLDDFPDKEQFKKKSADMKYLTEIDIKVKKNEQLTKKDLVFLYEMDSPIEGFGYEKDPRVKEILDTRNLIEDVLIVFDCSKEQIANTIDKIAENTKVFIGTLEPGIFDKLQKYNIEHVYTSFPEGKISRADVKIEGKSGADLKKELEDKGINIYGNAGFMLQSSEFSTSPAGETITTIRLKVRDLFFDEKSHNYDEIKTHAKNLGLTTLPHETASDLLLNEKNQPKLGEWFNIASETIPGLRGDPYVFDVLHGDNGLSLDNDWTDPDNEWRSGDEIMFGLRQVSQES